MFSNKGKDSVPTAPAPMAMAPAPAPKRLSARGLAAPSIISADVVVNGTLSSTGDIQIDGRVEGDVRSVGLVIGDRAEIHGEIYAEDVTVRGKVVGRIRARKVTLAATSHVEGDILHEAFAVESGAFFEGNCRHSDNPLDEPSRKPAPVVVEAPRPAPVSVETPRAQPMASAEPILPIPNFAPVGQPG